MRIIYVLQHTITKQIYIGKTDNLRQRIIQHNAN